MFTPTDKHYSQPYSGEFLFALNGSDCRNPRMFKILTINDTLVLSPKKDIHTTPSNARGILQKKE